MPVSWMQFSLSYFLAVLYNDFSYRAYKARKQLASIDWNYHINLPTAQGKTSWSGLGHNESDPALIAPTISHIPPPPMKEIIQKEEQVFKRITLKPNGQNE